MTTSYCLSSLPPLLPRPLPPLLPRPLPPLLPHPLPPHFPRPLPSLLLCPLPLVLWVQDDDWRVAETAVVGYPHELFGQGVQFCCCPVGGTSVTASSLHLSCLPAHIGIYAFVILRDGVEDEEEVIRDHLRSLVQKRIGSFAVPQQFLVRAWCRVLSCCACSALRLQLCSWSISGATPSPSPHRSPLACQRHGLAR